MKQNVFKFILLGIGFAILVATLYVYAPNRSKLTRITVVGDAQANLAPDTALITFAVFTEGKDALAAQQGNARRSEAVKTVVETATQYSGAEIKTSDYNLAPKYDYFGSQSKISGYEVKNSMTISIKDLTRVGAVIDAATRAGANSVEGVNFIIGEDSAKRSDALALAAKQAMTKAEVVAESLGGRIIRVVETHEGSAPLLPSGSDYAANMLSTATVAKPVYRTNVQPGSIDSRSNIILVVEVEM